MLGNTQLFTSTGLRIQLKIARFFSKISQNSKNMNLNNAKKTGKTRKKAHIFPRFFITGFSYK
jgi:hypothetical protein